MFVFMYVVGPIITYLGLVVFIILRITVKYYLFSLVTPVYSLYVCICTVLLILTN